MESLSSLKAQSWLSWFARGILILGFLILFARLFELQIIKGSYYRGLSEGNRISRIKIPAPRGKILARRGEVLVDNFEKDDKWERKYILGEDLAHVTGYLGQVSAEEVGKVDPECPEKGPRLSGSLIGRSGLEEEYNCVLAGYDGEELVEVDTSGSPIRTLGRRKPIPGDNLKTSIDVKLQEKAAESLKGKKGAIVISSPEGEIYALYSYPSYDPNIFVSQENENSIKDLLNDPNLPLFNRAIGGQFHPGSTFKPIVALAALSENKIDKNFQFDDPGVIEVNKFTYSNWYFTQYGRTEGVIGIKRAIARSTDTFFYRVGELAGAEVIANWADKFGLSRPTNIDIPGEVGGLVPTPKWKINTIGEAWFLGNTYHFSIGQGYIAITPAELNKAIAAFASEGKLCELKIAQKPKCTGLEINKEYLSIIKEGMVEACEGGGTGYTFFDFSLPVACKTGTAETSVEGYTHAWFTLFAPADYPEIVVTVLVEKGGEGSKVAGPIARKILDYWYETRP